MGNGFQDAPLKSLDIEAALKHWRNGEGATLTLDMYSHMSTGGGRVFDVDDFARDFYWAVEGKAAGTSVKFETNSIIRAEKNYKSAKYTTDYYYSNPSIEGAYVWGKTSAGFKGVVTVLDNRQLLITGEIRPYNEQFDFARNTWNPPLELARLLGRIWSGDGAGFNIRFVGRGRPIDGIYKLVNPSVLVHVKDREVTYRQAELQSLKDYGALQAERYAALSLEARDERVATRTSTRAPTFRQSENDSMVAYERQKVTETPSFRDSEIKSMRDYERQKAAAT
ncbi:hypothetical protein PDO_5134, partial [Rhizobium sp. PDO1-076]|uniref:hypothetical protein n=1 Tax=Rhizobium sp. PDO1-076 TaxID=1125979 RepID=UPI00024E327F